MQNFMREALVVKDLTHPNILSLLGVSISPNESPLVVVPLLARGDLRTYIKDTSKVCEKSQVLLSANVDHFLLL